MKDRLSPFEDRKTPEDKRKLLLSGLLISPMLGCDMIGGHCGKPGSL
jgi:hypothetical protein